MRTFSRFSRIFGGKYAATSTETHTEATQFLIVFDTQQGRIIEQRDFDDPQEAMEIFGDCERRHAADRDLQVLLFTADSLETVKSTHPHYFKGPGPSTDPFGLQPVTAH
jgi:hypothetical protein